MKNISKFYILITAFSLTLSSNASAQNEKKQVVKDIKKISSQDSKIASNDDNNSFIMIVRPKNIRIGN